MKIEIIHVRNPDDFCEIEVYVDDELTEFIEFSADPGAGHQLSAWEEATTYMVSDASPTVGARIRELRDEMRTSRYIDDDGVFDASSIEADPMAAQRRGL